MALGCFAERGFHGTLTRDIAAAADLSPAAVYVHFRSKAELHFAISRLGHREALRVLEAAAAEGGDVIRCLPLLVASFARWHAENYALAKVVQYELDALPRDHRREIYALRRRCEEIVEAELREGRAQGAFDLPEDVSTVTAEILSLCVDIARWYRPGIHGLNPGRIGSVYADLALRMVGADDSSTSEARF